MDKITSKWTDAETKEYSLLKKTAKQYFDIHAEHEVDLSGTARAAMSIQDKALQEKSFQKILELLETGKLPKNSDQQHIDADKRLNIIYQKIQKKPDSEWGTITKDGIKTTQRAWIKYRDAWANFSKKRHPGTENNTKTYLTIKCTKELEEILLTNLNSK